MKTMVFNNIFNIVQQTITTMEFDDDAQQWCLMMTTMAFTFDKFL